MAEKLTQRYFMSQDEFFKQFKCTASQVDDKGVVIYTGQVFSAIEFEAYANNTVAGVSPEKVVADRQQAVVNYLKKTYGRPAVKV